jgi:ring-1,2-phenylacetyl-CoA epoxidase subunit PaaB
MPRSRPRRRNRPLESGNGLSDREGREGFAKDAKEVKEHLSNGFLRVLRVAFASFAVGQSAFKGAEMSNHDQEWPLWEVFVRSKSGLDHKHCGSLHAADAKMAIQMARDVYTRRQEGTSVWVVRSDHIVASDPGEKGMYFDPMEDKVYRHPTFYKLPQSVDHM